MNVYEKLANVQNNLAAKKFNKSGHNNFGNFDYYELDDILPSIQKVCFDYNLLIEFTFSDEEATIKIRDWEKPEKTISNRMPMPPLTAMNKKMNIVQSLGSYITYLKRYLLVNTFLICENDIIESDINDSENESSNINSQKDFTTADKDKPLPDDLASSAPAEVSKVIESMTKRNLEVNKKNIRTHAQGMVNRKQLSRKSFNKVKSYLEAY